MKKHIAALFGFALLLAAASAHAQITETIRVNVPFPFVAAGKTLPAADYSVKITQDTGLVILSAAKPVGDRHAQHTERAPRKGSRQVLPEVRALRR